MRKFLYEARRILAIAKKPDKGEYMQVAKVAGIGILIIGFVGFAIMFANFLIEGILVSP